MKLPFSRPPRETPVYADTPLGIVSAGGLRFRTTEPLLRDYAGGVLDAVGLDVLIRRTETWVRSPQTATALALPLALAVMPWPAAVAVALLVYALWTLAAPSLASPRMARLFGVLEHPVLQGLLYVGVLSAFAARGETAAALVGTLGFVALRLGAVGAVMGRLLAPVTDRIFALPVPDQTLRALIVREAFGRGIELDEIGEISRRVQSFWRRGG